MTTLRLRSNIWPLTLLVMSCACHRKQAFPGYTYVGSDGSESGFVDLQSVRSDENGVTFSFISQQQNGQYAVLTVSSDCSSHFRRTGGTSYSKDGSLRSDIPADRQPSLLSADAVLNTAASAACGNPIVQVPIANDDFDAKSVLRVYGRYDPQSQTALWKGVAVPDRPELSNFKGVSNGTVGIAFDTRYRELGVDKHIVVTWTKPADERYDCHVCQVLLGVLVFYRRAGKWLVESQERYLLLGAPFGKRPRCQLIRIGPEKFGLVMEYSDMAQGFETTWVVLVAANGNTVRRIFALTTRQDPNDELCSRARVGDESCTHYSVEYRFVPSSNPNYFGILATKTFRSGPNAGSSQMKKFLFVGDKFISSSAGP